MPIRTILLAGVIVSSLLACDDDGALEPATIQLDLTGCVDDDPMADGCRGRLIGAAPEAAEQACLVMAAADAPNDLYRVALVWREGRLAIDGELTVPLQPGSDIEASLYFLTGDSTSCVLVGHGLRDRCGVGTSCVARFGPVSRTVQGSGVTPIDFVENDRCVVQMPAAESNDGALAEICGDGLDNDCDGQQDEDIVQPCANGVGACRGDGDRYVCQGNARACNGIQGSPSPDTTCDGIDDDCDGLADEHGECNSCLFDNECLAMPGATECVDGQCRPCDPVDGAGCPPEAPFCDPDTFECRGCADDAECDDGLACVAGQCADCDPLRPATCTEDAAPVCDADDLTCRPCQAGAECPTGFCFGGTCAPCDPSTNNGCVAPLAICDLNRLECRTCVSDAECAVLDPDNPVCDRAGGRCVPCNVADNAGCGDPSRPICAVVPPGDIPECGPCERNDECASGQCRNGRCVGCDPADDSGCDPLGGQPVCDPVGAPDGPACRACAADNECSRPGQRVCVGGRCLECDDVDHQGCDESGETPICQGGTCRACVGDNECLARPGGLDLCVGGQCGVCDPATNRGCAGNAPICDGGDRCRSCRNDGECGGGQCLADGRCTTCDPANGDGCPDNAPICSANGERCAPCQNDNECGGDALCVGGRCRQCDPLDNRGCDGAGITPVCDVQTQSCRRCDQDRDCPNNGQCLADGRCRPCDNTDNTGCDTNSAVPICGPDGTCTPCGADAECARFGLRPICDLGGGRCVDCLEAGNRGCDPASNAPVCEAGQCRICRADAECGNDRICEGGRCVGCSVVDNSGCDPVGGAPICDDGACRECRNNNECRDPQRTYCVDGACEACDADVADSCPVVTLPICRAGACGACQGDGECVARDGAGSICLADGRCATCNPATNDGCDENGAQPICDALAYICRACNQGECLTGDCDIVSGVCERCDPNADDTGCDPGSAQPICEVDDLSCRICEADPECDGNPYGRDCRGGACGCGNDADCNPASDRPDCRNNRCEPCNRDGQCRNNPNGEQCVNGSCRICDINAQAGNGNYPGCPGGEVCIDLGFDCAERCDPENGNGDCDGGEQCLTNNRDDFACQ